MSECPYIEKNIIANEFNKKINYKDLGGSEDYIFYDHGDAYGKITRVQYCQLMGRKRDVFECLNENEWQHCSYYLSKQKWEKNHDLP